MTNDRRRELRARAFGTAATLASMGAAWLAIGWPAPGLSLAFGLAVYALTRPTRRRR